uniref:Uncharacterized protein n=1 Tax=Arundo donax TaxID=35708 RepID=A0A0A9HRR6_ARUDO
MYCFSWQILLRFWRHRFRLGMISK